MLFRIRIQFWGAKNATEPFMGLSAVLAVELATEISKYQLC